MSARKNPVPSGAGAVNATKSKWYASRRVCA